MLVVLKKPCYLAWMTKRRPWVMKSSFPRPNGPFMEYLDSCYMHAWQPWWENEAQDQRRRKKKKEEDKEEVGLIFSQERARQSERGAFNAPYPWFIHLPDHRQYHQTRVVSSFTYVPTSIVPRVQLPTFVQACKIVGVYDWDWVYIRMDVKRGGSGISFVGLSSLCGFKSYY